MRLILLGPPGSGKGTIATMLQEHWGIPHISTGDLFRRNIREGTELGEEVKKYLDSGALVPDEVTMKMLAKRLEQDDAEKGYILDGFPRTVAQAEMLDQRFPPQKAVLLKVSDETVMERITLRRTCPKCGMIYHLKNIPPKVEGECDVCGTALVRRDDQKPEVVRNRLEVYKERTVPVIDHYDKMGLLVEVDGEGTPDVVFERIIAKTAE